MSDRIKSTHPLLFLFPSTSNQAAQAIWSAVCFHHIILHASNTNIYTLSLTLLFLYTRAAMPAKRRQRYPRSSIQQAPYIIKGLWFTSQSFAWGSWRLFSLKLLSLVWKFPSWFKQIIGGCVKGETDATYFFMAASFLLSSLTAHQIRRFCLHNEQGPGKFPWGTMRSNQRC